jgi:drug/metabolite transporter (DMT)-like permease
MIELYNNRKVVAHLLKVMSVILFIFASVLTKGYLGILDSLQQSFLIYSISSIVLCFFLQVPYVRSKEIIIASGKESIYKRLLLYSARVFIALCAKYCWFEAIRSIDMNVAISLLYLTPIFSVIFGVIFLGEKLKHPWFWPFLVAVLGVVLVFLYAKEDQKSFSENVFWHYGFVHGYVFAICSAFFYGLYSLIAKKQAKHEHALMQILYTSLTLALILAPFSFSTIMRVDFWSNSTLLYVLIIVGCFTVLRSVLLFIAYKLAHLTELAVHDYLQVVYSAVVVYYSSGIWPGIGFCIGVALIIMGNVALFYNVQAKETGVLTKY